jgi:hypothetical protein
MITRGVVWLDGTGHLSASADGNTVICGFSGVAAAARLMDLYSSAIQLANRLPVNPLGAARQQTSIMEFSLYRPV